MAFKAYAALAAVGLGLFAGGTFVDDDGNIHEESIEAIADQGITDGCNPPDNNRYCPGEAITRGQMAKFLSNALDLSPMPLDWFVDDDGHTFEGEINALATAGITRGCNPPANDRFCPNEQISRGQMAAMLKRAFRFAAGGDDSFADDDGHTFESDIEAIAAAGVTRGCNPPANDRFCPDDPVRRDAMASFVARALESPAAQPIGPGQTIVIDHDTMVHGRMVLRPGDELVFRNGAQLMFMDGGYADWQGTPVGTWSRDGEVQNLERDIEIRGQGSIMFMNGSLPSTIRFVEIDLQPAQEANHYPLHWHFVGNGSRGTLVEGVVVKNSTNRAYVPHASHGITFKDTIARNIEGSAYWWNEPDEPHSTTNSSNDILFDHALADTVTNHHEDSRGFRLAAFTLGAGEGNVVRDSVARNVNPTHPRDCAGFTWPELNVHLPASWEFYDNASFGPECHGIFVWQNAGEDVINGFRGNGIDHGAYTNDFIYRDIDVSYVEIHALGWRVEGGRIGRLEAKRHRSDERIVTFSEVDIGTFVVDNTSDEGAPPATYVFNGTNLDCEDIQWVSAVPGTVARIDGVDCEP